MWVHVEGATNPQEVDITSSRNWVYVRRNVTHVPATEDISEHYEWDEAKVAKDVWDVMEDIPVLNAKVVTLRNDANAVIASIATTEEATAQDNHDAGECLVVDGTLYRTTRVIVRGERVSPGINVEETTIIDEIARMVQERGQ